MSLEEKLIEISEVSNNVFSNNVSLFKISRSTDGNVKRSLSLREVSAGRILELFFSGSISSICL